MHIRELRRLALAAVLVGLALPWPARALTLDDEVAGKLDTRLVTMARSATDEPVAVWVTFRDKGETGPGDLARRLGEARAALDAHALARRARARVFPPVDDLDLPVHAPYLEALRAQGLAPYGVSRWFNGAAVRVPADRIVDLAALPFVARLAPVERGLRVGDPAPDPARAAAREARPAGASRDSIDYGVTAAQLQQIGVPALHDSGYIGTNVRIAVLDEGFNFLKINPVTRLMAVVAQVDFVDMDRVPTDTTEFFGFSHGQWTASCIGGNLPGTYVGAAPGADFALARTENSFSEHVVEMVYWGEGAEWADSLGADIISSSLGYTTFDSPDPSLTYSMLDGHTTVISRAAEIAASKGILVVNSAGNEGASSWHYIDAPADVNGDSLIATAAVDAGGAVADFSSYGPSYDGRVKPDLAARGVNTWVASSDDAGPPITLDGTSFSCPLTAGLAACLMQARPTWTPRMIIRALRWSASQYTAPDDRVGFGIPNGGLALNWIPDSASVPDLGPGAFGLTLVGPNPIHAGASVTRVNLALAPGLPAPRLGVFDAQGRHVRDLPFSATVYSGRSTATWDGRDASGRLLGAGLYFISLESGGRRSTVRVVSLR